MNKEETKERPILFSGAMIRAFLEGRKKQTRRIMKPQPVRVSDDKDDGRVYYDPPHRGVVASLPENCCPFGRVGDRLWVRETWQSFGDSTAIKPPVPLSCQVRYDADGATAWLNVPEGARGLFEASLKKRPSIHMPRWASRITLEITGIRVERLQDISEADAMAEGCNGDCPIGHIPAWMPAPCIYHYAQLWESINGPGSWDANPWVWVLDFKRIKP